MARPGQPDTRARIEEVALELFIEQGFSATSLQQIADRIGVTKAALYYHFPSKAELARSIFIPWKEDLDALLDEAESRGDLTPRELVERSFDVLHKHYRAFAASMRDASILEYVNLVDWTTEWAERFQTLLVGPEPTIAQRTRAAVALGGLNDAIFMLGGAPVDEVRPAAIDAALGALGFSDERSAGGTSPSCESPDR